MQPETKPKLGAKSVISLGNSMKLPVPDGNEGLIRRFLRWTQIQTFRKYTRAIPEIFFTQRAQSPQRDFIFSKKPLRP
jgi:hypothetical protein